MHVSIESRLLMCWWWWAQAGETYEENAYRELEEEMGIKGVPLEHLFTFYYEVRALRLYPTI